MIKLRCAALVAGVLAVVTPALAAVPAGASAPDDATIVIGLGAEPTSLDPHLVDDGGERAVNDNVYEPLLHRSPSGELEPLLAAELPTQVDELTWGFTLRDGVSFHDGTPFDSAAVVASVERMIRLVADGATDNGDYFGTLAAATAVDPLTVQITTTEPDGLLPARMNWLRMISPQAAESDDLSEDSNGTGPYRLADRELAVAIELTRNDDYWGGPPPIAGVRFEFIGDDATRIAAVRTGRVDLMVNLPALEVPSVPATASIAGVEHPVLILDANDGITADRRVREALNIGIDKQGIVDGLYGGAATIDAGQILSPGVVGFNEELEAYPYDPERAGELLAEAGAEGASVQLIGTSGRWINDRQLVEAIASYWTALGLDVQLEVLEFSQWLDVFFDTESQPDALFVSSSIDLLDPDRATTTLYSPNGQASGNSDPRLLELIDGARRELDAIVREEMYEEIMVIGYEQAYFVWLVNTEDIYGLTERMVFEPRLDARLIVREMSVTD